MKNIAVYLLAAGLLAAIAALGIAATSSVSGLPDPSLGTVRYIWIGAAVALAGLISFFIWLIRKGK
jgi:hypothetical protein